jgi:hypothetical protein
MTIDKKETKHTRYDEKRKSAPRLPSSRIIDDNKAEVMEQLYLIDDDTSKLELIVNAAQFALENSAQFAEFRNKLIN